MTTVDRFFGVSSSGSTIRREVLGGVATFMTMAYIIIVNPSILSAAFIGPDASADPQMFRAMVCATCLASAFATFLMGILARYPIALAPGMGLNAFFTYNICLGMNVPWQIGLGIVFISGMVFLLLSVVRIREMIIEAIPDSLKLGAAVGIGVFIAFIGLQGAGLVVAEKNTLVHLGSLSAKPVLVAVAGLVITAVLCARGVRGAILLGIVATGVIGYGVGLIQFEPTWFEMPRLGPVFGRLDVLGALKVTYIVPIVVLLFFDMFDTVGTLIGVSEQAGFMKEGKLPRASRALLCDATGTAVGSVLGTSTVTSYIESAAGVSEGARTGLANMVTAFLFVVAMFFAPVAEMLQARFVTAPALLVVGCLMMVSVRRIRWDDWTESMPAFLTIILMPLTFSISTGLFAGLIAYPLLKVATGRGREVHWLLYTLVTVFLVALVLYFVRFLP